MIVFLRILQGILAALFLAAGITKATQPREVLLSQRIGPSDPHLRSP